MTLDRARSARAPSTTAATGDAGGRNHPDRHPTTDAVLVVGRRRGSRRSSGQRHNRLELGMKFSTSLNGFIKGIRFYKGAGNTGEHIGKLLPQRWNTAGLGDVRQ